MADTFPASYAQEGLWLLAQLAPKLPLYQVAFPLRLELPLTRGQIAAALAALAARHETLRTTLDLRDDVLTQVVHDEPDAHLRHTDLRDLPPERRQERLLEIFYAEDAEPVPLDAAPLWRAHVLRYADGDWWVVFVAHHTVFDATSIMVVGRELRELCGAAVAGRAPALPELPVQYADFAAWQRGQAADGAFDADLRYWRARLAGVPAEHGLPADRPRPALPTFDGGTVYFVVPPDVTRATHRLARQRGASPFMVLLAAFQAVIARLSGGHDVVVGTPVAGRDLPELEPLVGMFVNTLVLRGDLSGDPPFHDLVDRARRTLLEVWEHRAAPFDVVVGAVLPRRDLSRNPLYQVGLNYLPERGYAGAGDTAISLAHDESFTLVDRPRAARFDLHLDVTEDGERLIGILEYACDLFDRDTARAFADRFARVLTAAVRDPGLPLSRLPLLADAERVRLSAPPPRDPHRSLPLAAPDRDPGDVAVVGGDGHRLTVAGLDERAEALAARLIAHGAGPDSVVAVLLPDGDTAHAVALLGVLKAGAAVLPLPAGTPPPRVRFLLTDARPAVVVVSERLRDRLPPTDAPVLCLDLPSPPPGVPPASPPPGVPSSPPSLGFRPAELPPGFQPAVPAPAGDFLALLSYPASAAGLPRAVEVTRDNLAAQVDQFRDLLGRPSGGTYAMACPPPPEVLLGALASGGTVHLTAGAPATADPATVDPAVVPADYVVGDPGVPARRALIVDGDLASAPVDGGSAASPDRLVVQRYPEVGGPALAWTAGEAGERYGRPLSATAAYVLDEHLEPVPDGVTGELCLGGDTVTRGYLRRPEPTSAHFVTVPALGGARVFRTGTRAARRPDGTITLRP